MCSRECLFDVPFLPTSHPYALSSDTLLKLFKVRGKGADTVRSTWLVGQDPKPGVGEDVDAEQGDHLGMVHKNSRLWASDHRAVITLLGGPPVTTRSAEVEKASADRRAAIERLDAEKEAASKKRAAERAAIELAAEKAAAEKQETETK